MSSGPALEGLSDAEAARRLLADGPNSLPASAPETWWHRVLGQLRSSLIYVLIFALAFDLAVWVRDGAATWPFESIAIAAILVFNTGMGVWQGYRSEDALARLRSMAAPRAWVVRDGRVTHVDVADLVVGDVVRVEAGDRVPADGVMVDGHGVSVDESILTGESVPMERLVGDALLSGSLAVRGLCRIEVTATGVDSTMGQIATMLETVVADRSPLERRLDELGRRIAQVVLAVAAVLVVAGVAVDGLGQFDEALLFAVAVAVAAVPEGMPAVLTLALALGTERMSKRRAVVRRLSAVETLGSVTVIATDKTGTLTENRMIVHAVEGPDPSRLVRAMALASDAEPGTGAGDPLELGLYAHAEGHGVDVAALRAACPRRSDRPFDAAWKYQRVTVIDEDRELVSFVKGAAEVVLERCELAADERAAWNDAVERHAAEGYRTLGFAWGPGEREDDLTWLGLAVLWDPPRAEVASAIAAAQDAGVRVLMITGDHPSTATAIATQIGIEGATALTGADLDRLAPGELAEALDEVNVFARVNPEHKLAIVDALKARGETVAMTGDGVNDAPALKRSDIGVAMGQRGSDVTREVADLVLLDDNFATIVGAIEEGRSIYENVQKFIRFLFSTNVALVLLIGFGVIGAAATGLRDDVGNLLVPLTAAQLLWINVLADGPPALALALDRNPEVMGRRPRRPDEPLFDRVSMRFVLLSGVAKAALGLALLVVLPKVGFSALETRSAVFVYEALAQLAFVYPARRVHGPSARNRTLNLVVAVSVVLQLATVFVPVLRSLLGVEPVPRDLWPWILGTIAASWGFAEATTRFRRATP